MDKPADEKALTERLELFRKECVKHLTRYGLTDYSLTFKTGCEADSLATCRYNIGEARFAEFSITDKEHLDPEDIPMLAEHEVLELLLAEIASLASDYYASDVVNAAVHRVIFRMMNADEPGSKEPSE